MRRFISTFVAVAVIMALGLGARMGWRLPDAPQPELLRRALVVAAIVVACSLLCGALVVIGDWVQQRINRRNDPFRRLH